MGLILRKVKKNRWYRDVDIPWLPEGDFQSDPLNDLGTSDNELSVFHVEEDESNLRLVVAALAANCDSLSHIDFVLFRPEIVEDSEIRIKRTEGESAAPLVNARWHRDLYEVSALRLVALARFIHTTAEIRRFLPKEVLAAVSEAVQSGHIPKDRVRWKGSSREKLDAALDSF